MDSREPTVEPLIGNTETGFTIEEVSYNLGDSLLNNNEASSLNNQSNYLELLPQEGITNLNSEVQELVFIDSSVTDSQVLIDNLSGATEVIILDDRTDGLLQISESLSQYQDVDAIHLVSHGDTGQLLLGNTKLSSDNLGQYADVLIGWDNYLTEDADILLYGCDVASSEEGVSFVEQFSQLTNADVSASDDTTGSRILGGDWDLEVAVGDVETKVAFDSNVADIYEHTLYNSSFDIDLTLNYGDLFINTGVFEDNFDNYDFSFTDGSDVDFSFTESDVDFDSVNFDTIDFDDNLTYEIYDTDGEVVIVETDFTAVDYSFVTSSDNFSFDTTFYLENDSNFANTGENPFLHYMERG